MKPKALFYCHSEYFIAFLSFWQLSDQICRVSLGSSSPAPIRATPSAGWGQWRPGCFGRNSHLSYSRAVPNEQSSGAEEAVRQRLAMELEVPAWEALKLVVGRVSCSLQESVLDVAGRWPSGEGEVSMQLSNQGNYADNTLCACNVVFELLSLVRVGLGQKLFFCE